MAKIEPKMGDERERKGSWAPGNYICLCMQCKDLFIGDKRAMMCADCAYGQAVKSNEQNG